MPKTSRARCSRRGGVWGVGVPLTTGSDRSLGRGAVSPSGKGAVSPSRKFFIMPLEMLHFGAFYARLNERRQKTMEYSYDQRFCQYRPLHKQQTTIKPRKLLKNAAVWCGEGAGPPPQVWGGDCVLSPENIGAFYYHP